MPEKSKNHSNDLEAGKYKQFLYEADSWQRLFEYMQTENIFMKYRLAQIVKEDLGESVPEEIESFQNQFIMQDKLIDFFRNDLVKYIDQLRKKQNDDLTRHRDLLIKQRRLRKEIEIAELKFSKMRMDYNSFFCNQFNQ